MELFITPEGDLRMVYGETLDLTALGRQQVVRASHVEPDDGGNWFAHIIDGPTLGPFGKRSDAIYAEVAWLNCCVLSVTGSSGPS